MTQTLLSRLAEALVPPNAGPDLVARSSASIVTIEPLSARALSWLVDMTEDDSTWNGFDLVVERRYFSGIADAAIAAGLTFEREAMLN